MRSIDLPSLLVALSLCSVAMGAPPSAPQEAPATTPSAPSGKQPAGDVDATRRADAKTRFGTGLKLFEEGDFSLALIEFERAYSLVPDYRVLYNIGQVNIQLARFSRAAASLEQYLADGGTKVPKDRLQSVQVDLEMLRSRTAQLTVTTNVEGAEILVDESVVGLSPMTTAIRIDAGEHRITVRKTGWVNKTQPLALAGRDESTLEITLQEEAKRVTTERTVVVERNTTTPTAAKPPPNPRTPWLIAGWSATGLLAAGWATAAWLGNSAHQELDSARARDTSRGELDDLATRSRNRFIAADVLGVLTIGVGGATLYYTLAPPSKKKENPKPRAAAVDWTIGLQGTMGVVRGSF